MTGRLSKTSGCTLHKMFMFKGSTIAQLAKTRPQDKARPKGLKEALLDDRPVVQDLRLHSS